MLYRFDGVRLDCVVVDAAHEDVGSYQNFKRCAHRHWALWGMLRTRRVPTQAGMSSRRDGRSGTRRYEPSIVDVHFAHWAFELAEPLSDDLCHRVMHSDLPSRHAHRRSLP